jgi:hypothetical protein
MMETKVLASFADRQNKFRHFTLSKDGILYGRLHPAADTNPSQGAAKPGIGSLKQPPASTIDGPPSKKPAVSSSNPSGGGMALGPRMPTPAQLQSLDEGFLCCLSTKKLGEISHLAGTFPFPVGGR